MGEGRGEGIESSSVFSVTMTRKEITLAAGQGQVILHPMPAALLLAGEPGHPLPEQLPFKEREVLSLVPKGLPTPATADSVCTAVKTVERHPDSSFRVSLRMPPVVRIL